MCNTIKDPMCECCGEIEAMDDATLCESCDRDRKRDEWLQAARETVNAAMAKHGASGPTYQRLNDWNRAVDSHSWYAEFSVTLLDDGGEEYDGCIQARVSDHYGRGTGEVNIVMGYVHIDEIEDMAIEAINEMKD